jgi:phosphoesterase RecJ-like protein
MGCDWRPLVELVFRHRRFLLTTHMRPDGDGLGSMKGLARALRQLGKQVRLVIPSGLSSRYDFLDPEREIRSFVPPGDEFRDAEVLVILDTGTWNQLGGMADFVRDLPARKVVIDHHVTQDDLGAQPFVDTSAEAVGRLTYELVRALGVTVTPEIAAPLFVALAMDTGWFRHGNVTPETFTLAHALAAAGARPDLLYQQLYDQNTLARMRLTGVMLERLTIVGGGRVAYSTIRRADYEQLGASPLDSEDLVNATLSLAGVVAGVLFLEQPRGGIKVSLRSREGVNIGKVAEQLGGGGHPQAAGAIVPGALDEVQARVLQAVEREAAAQPG